jgi:hypothetical protein
MRNDRLSKVAACGVAKNGVAIGAAFLMWSVFAQTAQAQPVAHVPALQLPQLPQEPLVVVPRQEPLAVVRRTPGDTENALTPAGKIVSQSLAAYAALKTYSGTTAVIMQAGNIEQESLYTSTAKIDFERGAKLNIDGSDNMGKRYRLESDGAKGSLIMDIAGIQTLQNDVATVASMTSLSSIAPAATSIPSLLLNTYAHQQFRLTMYGHMRLEGDERIGPHACSKVTVANTYQTHTYWIDQQNHLLRQMKVVTQINVKKLADAVPAAGLSPAANDALAQSTPYNITTQYVFAINKFS